MKVTIHQPEHVPWLGFFDKVRQADLFIVQDCVQFRKNYFQNRNRIRTPRGWTWITVPIQISNHVPIRDIRLAAKPRLIGRYLNLVKENYYRAPGFPTVYPELESMIRSRKESLLDLNMELLRWALAKLEIDVAVVLASDIFYDQSMHASDLVLELCRRCGAHEYISGISGPEYLKMETFEEADIAVQVQDFRHPIYAQLPGGFEPCMSVIDLLMNEGSHAPRVLEAPFSQRLAQIFV